MDSKAMHFDPFYRVNDINSALIDQMEAIAFLVNAVLEEGLDSHDISVKLFFLTFNRRVLWNNQLRFFYVT